MGKFSIYFQYFSKVVVTKKAQSSEAVDLQ